MKNKIYNIAIKILVLILIIVFVLIGINYSKINKKDEELRDFANNMKIQIHNSKNNEENKINTKFKGYDVLGIIRIPKIGIEYPILDKTNDETMAIAITKFWGNDINEVGNFSMAGHNYYNGVFFANTKKLENGDIIEMTDVRGKTIEYEVFKKYIIDPNDVTCVNSVNKEAREITLITCTNGRSNRLIIKAREKI